MRRRFEVNRFASRECEQWFRARQDAKFLVEKRVSPQLEEIFRIREAFKCLGWEPLLDLHNVNNNRNGKTLYYPQLVQEFYANIVDKKNSDQISIRSYLKGSYFELTEDILCQVLGVTNEGPRYQTKQEEVVHDLEYHKDEAIAALGAYSTYVHRMRGHISVRLTKQLSIRNRLLSYLLNFNVVPRANSYNELRNCDIYILYRLTHGLGNLPGLPLPGVIIKEILDVACHGSKKKYLCFPLILSRVFEHVGVDVQGEQILRTTPVDCLDNGTMSSLGYEWNVQSREWVKGPKLGGPRRQLVSSSEGTSVPAEEGPSHDDAPPSAASTTHTTIATTPPSQPAESSNPILVTLLQEVVNMGKRDEEHSIFIREHFARCDTYFQEMLRKPPPPPPLPLVPYPPPYTYPPPPPPPPPYSQDPFHYPYHHPSYCSLAAPPEPSYPPPPYSGPIPLRPGVSYSPHYSPYYLPPPGSSYPPPPLGTSSTLPYGSPYQWQSYPGSQFGNYGGPSSSYYPDAPPKE